MKTLLSLLTFVLAGIGLAGFGLRDSPKHLESSLESGKAVYEKYCSACHGLDGRGEGTAAIYLLPKPRDFTTGVYKFRSTPSGSLPTDDDLERTIRAGMPGSAMPAWDRLTDQNRRDLIGFLKSLSPRFSSETVPPAIEIEREPVRSDELIRKGKAIYALAGCWSCHGVKGAGDGPSSKFLVDDLGKPSIPYNFTRAGAFKGGGSPRDIYRTFSTGVGGTPMPAYGEDALAVGKEAFSDMTNLQEYYSKEEIGEFKGIIAQWPSEKALDKLDMMQRKKMADERRWWLVYYVLSLSTSGKKPISYTTEDHSLFSERVNDLAGFMDPSFDRWNQIKEVDLALISLWQRDTPADRALFRSVNDGKTVAFRLEWEDPTKDDRSPYNAVFGDAASIQFPLDPGSEPFFGMGDTNFVVNIWHWKSWWEEDLKSHKGVTTAFPDNATDFYPYDVTGGSTVEYFVSKDSAKALSKPWNAGWGSGNLTSAPMRANSVEDLNARGFGTLTAQGMNSQEVRGKGEWRSVRWSVVFIRNAGSEERNDVNLISGTSIPVAFAIWDGALGDRNGQKMVTNWYRLTIRK